MKNERFMYPNLKAEMARRNIGAYLIAGSIGLNISSFYRSLRGKRGFTLEEAIRIRDSFFPDFTLEQLFEKG